MRKLIAIVFFAITSIASCATTQAQTNTLFGVSLEMPVSEFTSTLSAKANDIASMAKAKKCKIEVNKYVPGETTTVCYVEITLDYKATESETAYAMLRSILNSKYNQNTERLVRLPIPKEGLFWRTPFGEVALYKVSDTIGIRVFNYNAINTAFNELSNAL